MFNSGKRTCVKLIVAKTTIQIETTQTNHRQINRLILAPAPALAGWNCSNHVPQLQYKRQMDYSASLSKVHKFSKLTWLEMLFLWRHKFSIIALK